MSDSCKAVADDEREWEQLNRDAKIPDVIWGVYDLQAKFAKHGYEQKQFYGRRLLLFVKHQIEQYNLNRQQEQELYDLEHLIKLDEKLYNYRSNT